MREIVRTRCLFQRRILVLHTNLTATTVQYTDALTSFQLVPIAKIDGSFGYQACCFLRYHPVT